MKFFFYTLLCSFLLYSCDLKTVSYKNNVSIYKNSGLEIKVLTKGINKDSLKLVSKPTDKFIELKSKNTKIKYYKEKLVINETIYKLDAYPSKVLILNNQLEKIEY